MKMKKRWVCLVASFTLFATASWFYFRLDQPIENRVVAAFSKTRTSTPTANPNSSKLQPPKPQPLETTEAASLKPLEYAKDHLIIKYDKAEKQKIATEFPNLKLEEINKTGYAKVFVPKDKKIEDFQKEISELKPGKDYIMRTADLPNDPKLAEQWYLSSISAEQAWNVSHGSPNVVIAIVDTGVSRAHEDLAEKILVNQAENAGLPTVDDDGNGYIDDIYGYDFYNDDGDPSDDHYHGTWVASLAAAATNNEKGIAGMGWNTKILPIKALGSNGTGSFSDIAEGIAYAIVRGAKIINLSLGAYGIDPSSQDTAVQMINKQIEQATAQGILVVAAAGNDALCTETECGFNYEAGTIDYPANHSNVLAVGALSASDTRSTFSNYGQELDISAPGENLLGAKLTDNSGYVSHSGTSGATAIVSGVAALLCAHFPSATPNEIIAKIQNSATKVTKMDNNNFHAEYGYGKINAYTALLTDVNLTQTSSLIISPNPAFSNQTITASFTVHNNSAEPAFLRYIGVAARKDGVNVDFPWIANVTIPANSDYEVTVQKSFFSPGTYLAFVSMMKPDGTWSPLPKSSPSLINSLNFTVQKSDITKIKVSTSLKVSPNPALQGSQITASFAIKNENVAPVTFQYLGVAARLGSLNRDFGWLTNTTIAAGETKEVSVQQIVNEAGSLYLWVAAKISYSDWFAPSGLSGATTSQWLSIQRPNLVQKTSLILSKSKVQTREILTASYIITNKSSQTAYLKYLGVAVRLGSLNRDFSWLANISIPANSDFEVSVSRSFTELGIYSAFVSLALPDGSWIAPAKASSQIVSTQSFSVTRPDYTRIKVTQALSISPPTGNSGETFTATFSVKNENPAPVYFRFLGVAARKDGLNRDLGYQSNLTIASGETKDISISRSYPEAGSYFAWIAALTEEGVWIALQSSSPDILTQKNITVTLPDIRLIESLVITPTNPAAGMNITASFKVKNFSKSQAILKNLGTAARLGSANRDIGWSQNLTLEAGAELEVSHSRPLFERGSYSAFAAMMLPDGSWKNVPVESGKTGSVNFSISRLPNVKVIQSLAIEPSSPIENQNVKFTFKVHNFENTPVTIPLLGVAVRYGSVNRDVAWEKITIQAENNSDENTSDDYTFEKSRSFPVGNHNAWIGWYIDSWGVPPKNEDILTSLNFYVSPGISGWIWNQNGLPDNSSKISTIFPFWYQLDCGNATDIRIKNPYNISSSLVAEAHRRGIKVVPTITGCYEDWSEWSGNMMADPVRRAKNISQIKSLVDQNNYDGIDIDYEDLRYQDRQAVTEYFQALRAALGSKIISGAFSAKISEPGHWGNSQAVDWEAVGALVDRFNIMLYEYSHSSPGPIAPLGWVEAVTNFAKSKMPAYKIVIGVGAYGNAWVNGFYNTAASSNTFITGRDNPTANGWAWVRNLAIPYDWPSIYETGIRYRIGKAGHIEYSLNGIVKEAWFEDNESMKEKLDFARSAGVRGIAIWYIGGENANFWNIASTSKKLKEGVVLRPQPNPEKFNLEIE